MKPQIIIYSGNPATDDYLHKFNMKALAKALPGQTIEWVVDDQPFVDNAVAELGSNYKGDAVVLKATAGFPNWGAVACGTFKSYRIKPFKYPNGKSNVGIYCEIELTRKFSKPERGGGGRRARGHTLFRV